jgi:hypothetical protein
LYNTDDLISNTTTKFLKYALGTTRGLASGSPTLNNNNNSAFDQLSLASLLDARKVENYKKKAQDFLMLTFVLIHILCGAPARVTEEESLMLIDTKNTM